MRERDLLQRFVIENDPEAFRLLVERHGAMVLAVCRSQLREAHDAEDAFQNTFLLLARRAGTIEHLETIGPWLRRVALRVAVRARAKACERRVRETARLERPHSGPPEPLDRSLIRILREEISRLPDRYRLPVVLCYLEGKTNEQAAMHLRCPVGTVKGRLSRARKRLRDSLTRRAHDQCEELLCTPARR
jgi:RNA polymerase sigma-70 factor (ECF subfamily)